MKFVSVYDKKEKIDKSINLAAIDYIEFFTDRIELYVGGLKIVVNDDAEQTNTKAIWKAVNSLSRP